LDDSADEWENVFLHTVALVDKQIHFETWRNAISLPEAESN